MLTLLLILVQACGAPDIKAPPTVQPPTDIPTPTAILHTVIPASLPAENSGIAADQDSARTSGERTAGGGDRFEKG